MSSNEKINIHVLSSYIKGQHGHLLGLSLFVIVFILYTLVARDKRENVSFGLL
jgi:hypothetical protein